jgi:hypothetical protein
MQVVFNTRKRASNRNSLPNRGTSLHWSQLASAIAWVMLSA